jgi:hypothetical protein
MTKAEPDGGRRQLGTARGTDGSSGDGRNQAGEGRIEATAARRP